MVNAGRTEALPMRGRQPAAFVLLLFWLVLLPGCFPASQQILHAKQLYNAGDYPEAIEAAKKTKADPATSPRVNLVLGRAYTQLYRIHQDNNHLDAARSRMAAALEGYPFEEAWENHELVTGLAELHYWEGEREVAAEIFHAVVLRGNKKIAPQSYANAVDWWANTLLATIAQRDLNPEHPDRVRIEKQIKKTVKKAYKRSYGSDPVLAYWRARAYVLEGNARKAWNVAVAGYTRSLPLRDPNVEDISDRLENYIEQIIIPSLSAAPEAQARWRERWKRIKARWVAPGP